MNLVEQMTLLAREFIDTDEIGWKEWCQDVLHPIVYERWGFDRDKFGGWVQLGEDELRTLICIISIALNKPIDDPYMKVAAVFGRTR